MQRYPSASAYQEALQHPEHALIHPDLRGASIAESLLGAPRVYSGARAAVFPIDLPSGKHALKFFVGNQPDLRRRYGAITRLAADLPPGAQPGVWLDEAAVVDGRVVPAILAAWCDGIPLNSFVSAHLSNPEVLSVLAENWLAFASRIEALDFAHGDLQHGNILISERDGQHQIDLIDFDGAFVPALRRLGPLDAGHRNYQHPDRGSRDFGAELDRFPTFVIYVALRAVAADASLWSRHDNGENMLFRASDFENPDGSALFEELAAIPEIARLQETLRACCLVRPAAIPPVVELVEHGFRPERKLTLGATSGRMRRSRWGTGLVLAVVVPFVVLFVVAAVATTLTTILIGAALAAAATATALVTAFLLSPEERRIRRLREQIRYAGKTITALRAERAERAAERERYLDRRDALARDRLERLRREALDRSLRHHFIQEVASNGYASHRVVIRMKRVGIRTAADIDEQSLARVTQVSETQREAVLRWRRDVEKEYVHLQPSDLSPAEQRRLERQIARRLEGFDRDERRLADREEMQRRILAELEARRPSAFAGRFRSFLRLNSPISPRRKL